MQYKGVTHGWRVRQLGIQRGKCPICRRQISLAGEGWTRAQADHCHETNEVRGLLCRTCNVGLGFFEDNIERLMMAVVYVKLHKEGKLKQFINALGASDKKDGSKEFTAFIKAAKTLGVDWCSLKEALFLVEHNAITASPELHDHYI